MEVWWPRLIAGFFSCPALLTPSAGGGGKGSPSSPGKKLEIGAQGKHQKTSR